MKIDINDLKEAISSKTFRHLQSLLLVNDDRRQDIIDVIYNKLSENAYRPSPAAAIVDVDKGLGVSRKVKIFNIVDYCVYLFCVYKLQNKLAVNRVEGTFGGWSLSNSYRQREEAEEQNGLDTELAACAEAPSSSPYSLQPGQFVKYWGEFNDKMRSLLMTHDASTVVLELDIANFYTSIRLDILESLIRSNCNNEDEQVIDLLMYFLRSQDSFNHAYRRQTVGLPQEIQGDCSRILANFYLSDFDEYIHKVCTDHNVNYLRYADDQVYVFSSGSTISPKELSRIVSMSLDRLGLSINSSKASISHNADALLDHKGISTYELLNQDIQDPAEQSINAIDVFCRDFIEKYKNGQLSQKAILGITKTIAKMGIDRLDTRLRHDILNKTILPNMPHYRHFNIYNLYNAASDGEKRALIMSLNDALTTNYSNYFKYEAYLFGNKANIDDYKNLGAEILNDRSWND